MVTNGGWKKKGDQQKIKRKGVENSSWGEGELSSGGKKKTMPFGNTHCFKKDQFVKNEERGKENGSSGKGSTFSKGGNVDTKGNRCLVGNAQTGLLTRGLSTEMTEKRDKGKGERYGKKSFIEKGKVSGIEL